MPLMVWLLMAALPMPAGGQAQPWGSITGRVVDAETLTPLSGAVVRLEAVSDRKDGYPVRPLRTAVTDSAGDYRFGHVTPDQYQILVDRMGYRTASVEVDLRVAPAARLSLGLEVGPVLLPPLEVTGRREQPFPRTTAPVGDATGGRVAVARLRQREFISLDSRKLTQTDVVQAITLAETDLFRALLRTPGISTRDDYTATLWTRGAAWDQTRVYFDGMPLFNPTHAGWLFSAVNPDAVGDVSFHPGVRSSRWGEGAAAVVDLQSRRGGGDGPLRGRGEVSLASSRLALDGAALDGRLNWMVAGRRTYVDVVTGLAGALSGNEELYIPYDFSDLVARVDGDIGEGWEYSASTILERDRLRGDVPGLLRGNRGYWGNRSGRLSVRVPLGPVAARVSAGETRFRAAILRHPSRSSLDGRNDPTLPSLQSLIRHQGLTMELLPASGPELWSLGYQVVHDSVGYDGPFSLLGELAVVLPRDSAATSVLKLGSRLEYRALWAERRFELGPVEMQLGVRAETGDSVLNGGKLRVAPRWALRWSPDTETLLSVGWSRAWQYTQDIAPVAGPLGPQLHLTHLWVLAQPAGYPALRADVATLGVERWFGDEWLFSANAYRRNATGVEVPNPDSGMVVPDRDPSVAAENRARGLELSLRRLAGHWTASVGYALGTSRMAAEIVDRDTVYVDFAGPADVRHSLDASALVVVGAGWRVGGAFTYGSGVPYTRLVLPVSDDPDAPVLLGRANGRRAPSYASLDLAVDYTTRIGSWQVTGFAQLRNALDRDNRVTYSGSRPCGTGGYGVEGRCVDGVHDQFEAGIPRLPLIGVRFTF